MQKARKDIYQEITDRIIAELENGTAPWLKPWELRTKDGKPLPAFVMPRNAVSGRKYSGINILILWSVASEKGYADERWMTFKQAVELGGKVRKGEKSATIMFLKPCTKTKPNDKGEDEEHSFMIAKAYSVFNVEQCEGLGAAFQPRSIAAPKPEPVAEMPAPMVLNPAISAWLKATGADIRHGGNEAFHRQLGTTSYIQMPVPDAFNSEASYWATMMHELTHWTKTEKRLNRDFGRKRWGDHGYAMEELVAELGAAFLCADHEVIGELRHAGYIESWLKVLRGDKRAIVTAASKASQAAEYLHKFSEHQAERIAA
jgi:antirestriction protein ArdC